MSELDKLKISQEIYNIYLDEINKHIKNGYKKEQLNSFEIYLINGIEKEKLLNKGRQAI